MVAGCMGLILSSCGSRSGWEVNGTVADAPGDTLVVESFFNGKWMPVDSVVINKDCTFRYVSEGKAQYPDIYRISLGTESIYFPIDSVDIVTIVASANNFAADHSLAGTVEAMEFSKVDSLIHASIKEKGEMATLNDIDLKSELRDMVLNSSGLMTPYYAVTKTVGGIPVFNPDIKQDLGIIGAVANRFNETRPDDTRTTYLVNLFKTHKFNNSATIEAQLAGLPENIVRYDIKGQSRSLAEEADKNRVTLLSFTRYDSQFSPAYNAELNKVWERYHNAGLQIYQIAFDENETTWHTAGANLPWISVWNGLTDPLTPLTSYMVEAMPETFIINGEGEVVERVSDPTKIAAAVGKYL